MCSQFWKQQLLDGNGKYWICKILTDGRSLLVYRGYVRARLRSQLASEQIRSTSINQDQTLMCHGMEHHRNGMELELELEMRKK